MKAFLVVTFLAVALAQPTIPPPEKSKTQTKRHLTLYNSLPQDDIYNTLSQDSYIVNTPYETQEVAQHTIHNVINKVPIAVPQPYAVPVTRYQQVPQFYPVHVDKPVPVGVRLNVPVPVEKPYPVQVPHAVPYQVRVKVPYAVEKPYPVTITRTIPVHVEKPVYVKVPEIVKVPVAQPYPVAVQRKVSVTVPEPVLVKVPEYYNVQHKNLPIYYTTHVSSDYMGNGGLQSQQFINHNVPDCPLTQKQNQYGTVQTYKIVPSYGTYGIHNIFSRSTSVSTKDKKN